MDTALDNVNRALFGSTAEKCLEAYGDWSTKYDEDLHILGCSSPIEITKMFVKYAMNSNAVLDVGGGKIVLSV